MSANKINIEQPVSSDLLQKNEAARCAVNNEGIIVYANSPFCELSGITLDRDCHLFDIIQFSDEVIKSDAHISSLPAGTHDVHIRDNGILTEFHFDWVKTPDNTAYLIASALQNDVDENQINQDLDHLMSRIQKSAARIDSASHENTQEDINNYASFIEISRDLMAVINHAGDILYKNDLFSDVTGYGSSSNIQSFFDIFPNEDQYRIKSIFSQSSSIDDNQVIDFESRIIGVDADSTMQWISWSYKYQGNNIYITGRNITDIKKKQEDLHRRERQLSEAEAIGRMGHWHWLIGDESISWSEEIFRIFGIDQNHFRPSINSVTDLIHKRDLGRVVQVFQRAIIEEKNYDMEFRILRPGGDVRFIMCEGRCEKNADGEVVALYGIMQDMTERMLYEEELRHAKDSSEQAYAAKSRFLANMSHELRTPLNAIIGFSEMIEQQMLGPIFNEKYLEYATSIRTSGHHLLDLISDILDMSKIEAGKHVLDLEMLKVQDIIDRSIEMVQGRASEQSIALRPCHIENADMSLVADRRALTQILLNLLSNAIKFTPENGAVWLECFEQNHFITFKVCDTGVGIPPNKLAAVLRPFEQASSEYTRDYEGTGLGLSITKELIEMHGGTISIKSTVDVGTTVTVRLPIDIASD